MKFGIQMFYRAWGGVFSSSKMSTFDFYWIPITLTITHYQNRLLINRKMKMAFNGFIVGIIFMEFKTVVSFQKILFSFLPNSHYFDYAESLQ